MANRTTDWARSSFVKRLTDVYADVKFGADGSATLFAHPPLRNGLDSPTAAGATGYQGVYAVSQAVSGVLTLTLQDRYYRVVDYSCAWSGSAHGPNESWVSASFVNSGTIQSHMPTSTVKLAFADHTGTLETPASGTEALIHLTLANSSVAN